MATVSSAQIEYIEVNVSKGGTVKNIQLSQVWKKAQQVHQDLIKDNPYIYEFSRSLTPHAKYEVTTRLRVNFDHLLSTITDLQTKNGLSTEKRP
jgi:hypothetical protein